MGSVSQQAAWMLESRGRGLQKTRGAVLAQLDAERFPRLVEMVRSSAGPASDDTFLAGLDAVIVGLAAVRRRRA